MPAGPRVGCPRRSRRGARNAATLAHGTQRQIEMVGALALRPRALLLDEPAAGMDDGESAEPTTVSAVEPARSDEVRRR